MINCFKFSLTQILLLLIFCVFPVSFVWSQADTGNYTYPFENRDFREEMGEAPVVVEMFSSQACPFCLAADHFFADLVEHTDVIGVACHIDFFDVQKGSLSKPFCNARQEIYANKLAGGLTYVPQMVLNGTEEVRASAFQTVAKALVKASKENVKYINIKRTNAAQGFSFRLPEIKMEKGKESAVIWLILYDKPHDVRIAEGKNKDRTMRYVRIADEIQKITAWDGAPKKVKMSLHYKEHHAGMIILAQDQNHRIIAAGEYRFR